MTRTIGIISIKGGVGKTTLAASMASDLVNHYQKKVLLVDANFTAPNLGLHMDIVEPEKTIHHVLDKKIKIKSAIQNKFGVDVIPGNYIYNRELNLLKLKDHIKSIKEKYDFIIIDSSPNLNDEVLSTILASDALFVVTTPDYPTLSCSLKAAKLAKQRGKPIRGIIINKIRDPKYEINIKEIEESLEIPVIARIPDDKTAVRALFSRIPISIYKPNSKFAKEVSRLNSALSKTREKFPLAQRVFPFHLKKEQINRQLLRENFYKRSFK